MYVYYLLARDGNALLLISRIEEVLVGFRSGIMAEH